MADAKLKKDFEKLTRHKYTDQAKWFLNGFWEKGADKTAEDVWNFAQGFIKFDEKKGAGNELDEFWSHKFLESIGETLTVVELRAKLKKIDLDETGKMALLEFLAFHYGKTLKEVVTAPQGANAALIREAADKLERVQTALVEVQAALETQKTAEEALKKSQAELKVAVTDLEKQESAYKSQISSLEEKINDPDSTPFKQNKASAELSQLKSEDPLPLRKAKISQEAALRKVEKGAKAAEVARITLEQKEKETEKAAAEAEAFLEDLKSQPANPYGAIWWMERELAEAQKYLPKKKK